MAWHKIEDTEEENTETRSYTRDAVFTNGSTKVSCNKTLAFSIYRCGNCRALAVCKRGDKPLGPCGKCGAGVAEHGGRAP